jgi:hypothetical protein
MNPSHSILIKSVIIPIFFSLLGNQSRREGRDLPVDFLSKHNFLLLILLPILVKLLESSGAHRFILIIYLDLSEFDPQLLASKVFNLVFRTVQMFLLRFEELIKSSLFLALCFVYFWTECTFTKLSCFMI